MKKTTTAAIAATLGAALLLGGAGTLAYWSDAKNSTPQQVQTGNLALGSVTDGTWSVQQFVGDKATSDSHVVTAKTNIVPGDVLTQTVNVPVTLVGDDLRAELSITGPTFDGVSPLRDKLTAAITSVNGTAVAPGTAAPAKISLLPGDVKAGVVPVTVTVTYPFGTTAVNAGQANEALQTLTINSGYTLTQVPFNKQ